LAGCLLFAGPQAGGEYVYLREAYGPMPAFLSGWTSFFVGFSAPLAVAGYIAALYLLTPFGLAEEKAGLLIKATAAIIIAVITLPNLIGHRQSAWTQNLTTILKFGLFVALVVMAFLCGSGKLAHIGEGQPIGSIDLGTAATQLFYVMFAYSGWNAASYLAGEIKDPARVLPRSLLLGTGLVITLYLAVNLVFAYAVPLAKVGFDNVWAEGFECLLHPARIGLFGDSERFYHYRPAGLLRYGHRRIVPLLSGASQSEGADSCLRDDSAEPLCDLYSVRDGLPEPV